MLVLDNLGENLDFSQLKVKINKSGSKILITSRINSSTSSQKPLPLLEKNEARIILEKDVESVCPSDILDSLYDKAGGYPLIYRLMNSNLRDSEYSWEDIRLDIKGINEYTDEVHQKLVQRLLGHLTQNFSKELGFLKACKNNWVEKFARILK